MQALPDITHSGRSIRSYVLRAGRLTAAQARALTTWWPHYGVAFEPRALDLDQLFARHAPRTLEIGFGNGDNLLSRAVREPERDFLGVEVHRPGIGHLLLGLAAAGVSNVRIIAHDAMEVLEQQLPAASLDEVQLLFPDPWPKKRHHKRRLVRPAFITLVASLLTEGGRLHIATDWEPYAQQMQADVAACSALTPHVGGAQALQPGRDGTRFEKRGARLGHRIHELLFIRQGRASN